MFYSFGVDFRESLYFSRLGCPKKKRRKICAQAYIVGLRGGEWGGSKDEDGENGWHIVI